MRKLFLGLLCFFTSNVFAQSGNEDSLWVVRHYDKAIYSIPMRDGAKLHTIVYTPKDGSKKYPFLINRTCYNAGTYDNYNLGNYPSKTLIRDGYILVYQDVRGRYLSEGTWTNMTPNIPGNDEKNKTAIDESSDTWDTIEWLLKHVKNHNGKVGQYGISYPGFYSAAALPNAHPALKAVSPQAPIADFFFDDFHHQGAFVQAYTAAFPVFGYNPAKPTKDNWFLPGLMRMYPNGKGAPDGYTFYMRLGPLKNITEKIHYDNYFWKEHVDHPNYDTFWQKRNLLPHLKNVSPAVLTVGGWFDAEDLYGPLNIYKTIEKNNPGAVNHLVMGPWGHGDWARETGKSTHHHIYFGDSISTWYQNNLEAPFFTRYLKDDVNAGVLAEASVFNTGTKKWESHAIWPPEKEIVKLSFAPGRTLRINSSGDANARFDYISDPANPVPYTSQIEGLTFTPRNFMSDDQRHASKRPDVLTFETEPMKEDFTLSGEILAKLKVATTGTDADFMVKLIDVYPDDHPNYEHNPKNIVMGGYQQLVRSEAYRARFRNSFEKPESFVPNQPTNINIPIQDVLHTFKKGHRIMIQIHSTWFPYIDRNPQQYVENIFKAEEGDFQKATITVFGSSEIWIGSGLHTLRD
jgi:putative CocE/NonD family hydrolase